MQTFRKLPIVAPNRPAVMYKKMSSGTAGIVASFRFPRQWVRFSLVFPTSSQLFAISPTGGYNLQTIVGGNLHRSDRSAGIRKEYSL
jgi:hypothetical protein